MPYFKTENSNAENIKYDNTKSVKEAIDDIKNNQAASSVTFNNTDTGLNATNVQDAVTEINGKLGSLIKEGSFTSTTNANGVITASDSGVSATDKIVLQAFVPSYLAYAYINESTTAYGFKIVNTVNNNPYANQSVTVTYYYIEK